MLDPEAKFEIEPNEDSLQVIVIDKIKLYINSCNIYIGLCNEVLIDDAINFVKDY